MRELHNTHTDSACNYVVHALNKPSKLMDKRHTSLNRMLVIMASIFALVVLMGTASATDYYVATWGDNRALGDITHPWRNVSYATQQATAGDTIHLFGGTWYDEEIMFTNSGTSGQRIVLTAYNGTPTLTDTTNAKTGIQMYYDGSFKSRQYIDIIGLTISGYHQAIYIRKSLHVNIADCTINIPSKASGNHGGIGIYDDSHHISVDNCTVIGDGWNSVSVNGRYLSGDVWGHISCDNVSITNCEIYNNTHHNLIDIKGNVFGVDIIGNHLYNCDYNGFYTHQGCPENVNFSNNIIHDVALNGMSIYNIMNSVVSNNTIYNSTYGIRGYSGENNIFVGNIIYNTVGEGMYYGYTGTFDSNHVYDTASKQYRFYNTLNTVKNMVSTNVGFVLTDGGDVIIEYDNGAVFSVSDLSGGSYTYETPKWYPTKSKCSIVTSDKVHTRFTTRAHNITLRPTSGHLYDVTVDAWDEASGTYRITASSTEPYNPTWINFTTKDPSSTYNLKKDDEVYDIQAATDAGGVLRYHYTGQWGGSHTFEVSESASDATPHIINLQNDAPTQQTVTLHWGCSVSNIDHYTIYKNGTLLGITENQHYLVTQLSPNTPYTFNISATTTGGITGEIATLRARTTAVYFGRNAVRIADDVTASRGNRVAVPIRIYNATDVACAGVKLTYDASVVTVTGVTEGDFTTHLKVDDMHAVEGWTVINTYIEGTQLTGDIGVAEVTLVAVGNAGDTSPLDVEILSMATQNGYSVPRTVSNGLFTVVSDTSPPIVLYPSASQLIPDDTDGVPSWGETATLSVTVTDEGDILSVTIDLSAIGGSPVQPMTHIGGNVWSVTTSASAGTPPQTYELQVCATDTYGYSNMSVCVELVVMRNGDVTGDGDVNSDDVTLLGNYVTYSRQYTISSEFVADVTGDSVVDIADAMLLANCVNYTDQYTLR